MPTTAGVILLRPRGTSGGGANVATELLSGTQDGNNVLLDLTGLAETYSTVINVFRQGAALTPTTEYTQAGDVITVLNADAGEDFLITYTYV